MMNLVQRVVVPILFFLGFALVLRGLLKLIPRIRSRRNRHGDEDDPS